MTIGLLFLAFFLYIVFAGENEGCGTFIIILLLLVVLRKMGCI